MRKVGIIGVGNVGSHVAHGLLNNAVCNNLVLIDTKVEKVISEKLDLEDSIAHSAVNANITVNNYSALKDAAIVVIAAGKFPDPNSSRLEALSESMRALDDILPKITESGFNGIYLVITNPCDVVTWHVLNKTKADKHKVFGTGTMLDTARFKRIAGKKLKLDPKSINGFTMGEHGDSQFIPWSNISIGTMPIKQYLEKSGKKLNFDDTLKETINAGYEIIKGKGATYFGIAMCTTSIIKCIFDDEHTIFPVSAYLDGEYGIYDTCISVPCVVGRKGIVEVIETELTDEEDKALQKSAEILQKARV